MFDWSETVKEPLPGGNFIYPNINIRIFRVNYGWKLFYYIDLEKFQVPLSGKFSQRK